MSPLILLGAVVLAVILAVIALLFMARGAPDPAELINARLAEFSARDEPMTLEEIELSLRFRERVLIPLSSKIGKIAARFTPQATLENARRRLEMAGGTVRMDPAFFLTMRIVVALVFGGMVFIVFIISKRNLLQGMLLTVLFLILGYMFPEMMLTSRIKRRQRAVFRAMPDALDLLTICVEAGLGFDAAMS
ncbi:MAG: hypothetical protein PVJ32_07300, partial [Anaerolineales bacterium]